MTRFIVFAGVLLTGGCARPVAEGMPPASVGQPSATAPARAIPPAGNPAVGGVAIPTDQLIVADLRLAPNLTGFVRAIDAAGLADTLAASGPFTVFAPSDAAFGRLQPGTVEALMMPEHRGALIKLLSLHLVPERLSGVELVRRVAAGGGRTKLMTVAGEALTATLTGGIVTLTDAGGNRSYVETADVRAANGVVHVVNGVLIPRLD